MYASISATDFRRRLARDPGLRAVDVRTPAEYRESHVVGAVNKPLDKLSPEEFAGVEGELFVLCRSGGRAGKACEKLAAGGVAGVVHVEGGTLACAEVGVELKRGKKAISLERQVRIAAGALVLAGLGLSLLHPAWLALSGFVAAGLVFAGVSDTCGMGTLLALAPWNQGERPAAPPSPGACSRSGPQG